MGFVVNYPPVTTVTVDESTNEVVVAAAGPRGPQGAQGDPGDAATVAVGTTSTGAEGSDADVTNSGTSSAAVLDFTIPRGDTGATGAQGPQGDPGVVAAIAPITYDSGTQTVGINEAGIEIAPGQVTGTAVVDNDSRLSDARTPTAHATSHESGGGDELTLAQSQVTGLVSDLAGKAAIQLISPIVKADFNSVAFTKTGDGTAEIKAGTYVNVDGTLVTFGTATAITMPTLTAGTDYFIYVVDDGSIEAVAATGTWPTPVASPPADSVLIGGFHYAPGGNAAAQAGGDTTASINEYSLWDLKWRPAAPDPRGMTLVNEHFWSDIYLLNTTASTNGTSANDKTIYDTQTWWDTAEELGKYGKRLPRYREFCDLAYGTTENQSRGNDPVTTGLGTTNTGSSNTDEEFTSKWGVIQATGCLVVWGDDFGGGNAASSWADIAGGRGRVYAQENAVRLGGLWTSTVNAGSRSSIPGSPSATNTYTSGRGVCDHLRLV